MAWCLLIVVAALAIVAWRLGPSLVGSRVFLGVDMFDSFLPWSQGQPRAVPAQNAYIWDHLDFFVPGYAQIVDRLLQGDIPLWSPLVGGGTPLLAQPNYGIFSPARWPYLVLPLWWAPAWSKAVELVLAGAGSWLLSRRLGLSKPAAGLAALVYPFTGFMLAWTNWPQTAVAALIPGLFWAVERFVQERRVRAAGPIAVVVAAMMFGGFPAVTGLSLYAAGIYLIVRLLVAHHRGATSPTSTSPTSTSPTTTSPTTTRPTPDAALTPASGATGDSARPAGPAGPVGPAGQAGPARRAGPGPARDRWRFWRLDRPGAFLRDLLLAALAVAVGVAVSAVQLLPFLYSFIGDLDLSYRQEGFFRLEPPGHLLSAVFPGSFAGNALDVYSGAFNPIEVNTYVGSTVLVLVVLALLRRPGTSAARGARGYFVGLAVVGLLLIWVQGPLLSWLGELPIFADNPIGRVRALLGIAAAMLAAYGYDALHRALRTRRRVARQPRMVEAAILVLGLLGLIWAGWRILDGRVEGLSSSRDTDVWVALGIATLVVGLILLGHYARFAKYVLVAIVPLLVAGQAGAAAGYYWPTADRADFYPTTAVHQFLQDHLGADRVATTARTLWPSTTAYYGIRTVSGHAFLPVHMRDLLLAIDPTAYPAPTSSTFNSLSSAQMTEPGLDRLAARYYATGFESPMPGVRAENAPATGELELVPGQEHRAKMRAQPLRGVGISVPRTTLIGLMTLTVTVRDESGDVVASGSRNLRDPGAGSHFVPIAGEDLVADGSVWTVQIEMNGGSGPLPVATVGPGQPQVATLAPANDGLRLAYVADGTVLWERLTSLPRIRWASDYEVIPDADERLQTVAHDEELSSDTVLLDAPAGNADGDPAGLRVLEDAGDTIRVNVDAEGAGFLVVADNIQTDWVATVDGTQVPIVEADYALGAVHVNPGEHEIVLRYAPRGAVPGAVITLIAIGVLVALALPVRFWRRVHRGLRRRRVRPAVATAGPEPEPVGRRGDAPADTDNDRAPTVTGHQTVTGHGQ